jgi:hypothetical protein
MSVASYCRQSNQKDIRRHVTPKRSIDWKLVDSVFEPLHARFDFTFDGCADDEGLNSHGDLSGLSSTNSLDTGTCTKNSWHEHNCLLVRR